MKESRYKLKQKKNESDSKKIDNKETENKEIENKKTENRKTENNETKDNQSLTEENGKNLAEKNVLINQYNIEHAIYNVVTIPGQEINKNKELIISQILDDLEDNNIKCNICNKNPYGRNPI